MNNLEDDVYFIESKEDLINLFKSNKCFKIVSVRKNKRYFILTCNNEKLIVGNLSLYNEIKTFLNLNENNKKEERKWQKEEGKGSLF